MTTSPLAYEEFTLAHDRQSVRLRPSLRAASLLVRAHGLNGLFRALDEFNTTIISEIILAAADDKAEARAYLKAIESLPLLPVRLMIVPPLYELIEHFTPAPDPDAKQTTSTSKPLSWSELYADMFTRATGWLGLSPADAWNSTPREIELAFAGHIDQLKAIHGTSEAKDEKASTYTDATLKQIEEQGFDPAFNRSGLAQLKAKIAGAA